MKNDTTIRLFMMKNANQKPLLITAGKKAHTGSHKQAIHAATENSDMQRQGKK